MPSYRDLNDRRPRLYPLARRIAELRKAVNCLAACKVGAPPLICCRLRRDRRSVNPFPPRRCDHEVVATINPTDLASVTPPTPSESEQQWGAERTRINRLVTTFNAAFNAPCTVRLAAGEWLPSWFSLGNRSWRRLTSAAGPPPPVFRQARSARWAIRGNVRVDTVQRFNIVSRRAAQRLRNPDGTPPENLAQHLDSQEEQARPRWILCVHRR